ncbi:Charged multivesicular body protein 2b, variant 2 [Balamuthia mandrillaris]
MFPFRQKKTPEQVMRENSRGLKHSQRDLDKEIQQLERQEKQTMAQIKVHLRKGEEYAARQLSKQVVQMRAQRERLLKTKGTLSVVNARQASMKATHTMGVAMGQAGRAMAVSNKQVNLPKMQATLQQFERQMELSSMQEEMLDEALEGEFDDEESDAYLDQVFDEIGLELSTKVCFCSTFLFQCHMYLAYECIASTPVILSTHCGSERDSASFFFKC